MMKYMFSLILTLLFLSFIRAYPSQQQIADSGLAINRDNPESGISPDAVSLDYTVSETAVKGFIIPSTGDFAVQLGAFKLKLNAEAFLREVRDHLDKNAIMIEEDGYYKVRISKIAEQVQEKNDQPEVTFQEEVQPPDSAAGAETTIASLTGPGSEVYARSIPGNNADPGLSSDRTEDIIFLNDENPWLKRIDYFGKSIAFVNALIITITVSIATMLILLMIILLNRRRMEKEEKLHQYLLEKYQGLIVDYLFGNANPDDFRPIASDTYR
ncbi:MAG: SPOR domain-containing protein, partial [Bacteroidales bacterium]|nr:SPOR domain-containing protein [Bacteroidales bacterium]